MKLGKLLRHTKYEQSVLVTWNVNSVRFDITGAAGEILNSINDDMLNQKISFFSVDEEDPERLFILLRDYEDDEDEEEIIDYGKMEVTGREIPFEEMLEK